MDCKKALGECAGDLDAAAKWLREKGISKAAKKADRDANEGLIIEVTDPAGQFGMLAEINCETDFVAKNDSFQAFVKDVGATIADAGVSDLESALAVEKGSSNVDEFVKSKVIEVGENLKLANVARYDVEGTGAIASYIHMGGKVGVLVEVAFNNAESASKEACQALLKDLSLHVAASAPAGLSRDDIPTELVEAEKEVFRKQMENSGKPANIIDKIVEGKLGKFYSEQCFLEQSFIKNPDQSINELIASVSKEIGDDISVKRFTRFAIGA